MADPISINYKTVVLSVFVGSEQERERERVLFF